MTLRVNLSSMNSHISSILIALTLLAPIPIRAEKTLPTKCTYVTAALDDINDTTLSVLVAPLHTKTDRIVTRLTKLHGSKHSLEQTELLSFQPTGNFDSSEPHANVEREIWTRIQWHKARTPESPTKTNFALGFDDAPSIKSFANSIAEVSKGRETSTFLKGCLAWAAGGCALVGGLALTIGAGVLGASESTMLAGLGTSFGVGTGGMVLGHVLCFVSVMGASTNLASFNDFVEAGLRERKYGSNKGIRMLSYTYKGVVYTWLAAFVANEPPYLTVYRTSLLRP